MSPATCAALEAGLRQIADDGAKLRIICSRRTPEHARGRFRALASDIGAPFWADAGDGPNPYLAWLSLSEAVLVTEDSTNMMSEAAWFAKPVHIVALEGGSAKFSALREAFIRRGIARPFEGAVATWDYPPLREIDRVADAITERLLAR